MLWLVFAAATGIVAGELVNLEVSSNGDVMEMAVGPDGDITSFAQTATAVNVRGQRGSRVAYGVQADGSATAVGVAAAAAMDDIIAMEVVPDVFLLQTNLLHRREGVPEEGVASAATMAVEVKEAGDVETLAEANSLMQTGTSQLGSGNQTATIEAAGAVNQAAGPAAVAAPVPGVSLVQTDAQVAAKEALPSQSAGLGLQMAAGAPVDRVVAGTRAITLATVVTTGAPGWAESTGETVKGVLLQSPGTIIVNAWKSLAANWTLRHADGSSVLDKITVEPWKQRELLVFLVAAVLMQMLLFRWLAPPMPFESSKSAAAAGPYIK